MSSTTNLGPTIAGERRKYACLTTSRIHDGSDLDFVHLSVACGIDVGGRLWQSILLSDEAKIEYYCRKMGVDEMYHLLAAMLTMRPWDDIASNDFEKLQARGTSSDNAMIRAYAFKYFKHIADVLTMVRPEVSTVYLIVSTTICLDYYSVERRACAHAWGFVSCRASLR